MPVISISQQEIVRTNTSVLQDEILPLALRTDQADRRCRVRRFPTSYSGKLFSVVASRKPESGDGLKIARMTRIVLRIFSRHHLSSQPLMSRAMAKIQSCAPSVWQVRAAQARRIASMLVGDDAEMVEAYARECDEQGRDASAKTVPSPSLVPAVSPRVVPLMSRRSSAGTRAA